MKNDKNIIHVRFGPGGGRRREPEAKTPAHSEAREATECLEEPFYDLYGLGDVSQLFDISKARLRYWERSNFIPRSARIGKRRYYTFQDLITIRAAEELLRQGVALRNVRRSVAALSKSLPHVARPLSSLRIFAEGQSVIVKDDSKRFDPITGQLVFDFDVSSLRDDVVRVLSRDRFTSNYRTAYEWYLQACRLDEDERTYAEAEKAYRKAIRLDPSFANAFTNYGNLLFRKSEMKKAEAMYEKALRVDPKQPEALYNLGFLRYDQGDLQGAIVNFKRALNSDPSFADAHFNLAMVLEEIGRYDEARPHWETYLALDSDTSWAEIARRHLDT
ncbi:MAG: tetratricopeptide repeat protein [Deltaproteobacteria bacterium]|nr:tetratricopeptide repeat protein [Deltaproteobacteria bacterium]